MFCLILINLFVFKYYVNEVMDLIQQLVKIFCYYLASEQNGLTIYLQFISYFPKLNESAFLLHLNQIILKIFHHNTYDSLFIYFPRKNKKLVFL